MKKTYIILLLILLLGLFFRIYKLEIFYSWGHDQDLFAWIAKDILVDYHPRLIGQETSITGVFIGPLFYYLIALSFAVFKMNPLSAAIVTTTISLFTILSIYWVFNKFFGLSAGLIGSFLYAVSPGVVFGDRWVVPTQPTPLWTIWYFYVLFSILNGNLKVLIPLSILVGLIWHVHIAFIPLLILLPVAFLLSEKRDKLRFSLKSITISLLIFFVLISPFFAFEFRHNFQQTKSLIGATYQDRGDLTGLERLIKVLSSGGRALVGTFVLSNTAIELEQSFTVTMPFILILITLYLRFTRILNKNQVKLLLVWYLIVFLGQFLSKRIITEYYFSNLIVIFILILSLFLNRINIFLRKFPLSIIVLSIYLIVVTVWFINKPDDLGGYLYKRQAIEYIKNDVSSKGYRCIAINHIENQKGGATGFRYLFWLNKLLVVTSGNDVPVYSIVNPWLISEKEIKAKFGNIGVIIPAGNKIDPEICYQQYRQLLPLWGFNN
ncbi:glycosyltransferase family 39 protein [Candidatus Daviesbacteria bacterium]|nr:glycosyltransferase family 39 protein [Candidatus Daviesbacteria bacterium]